MTDPTEDISNKGGVNPWGLPLHVSYRDAIIGSRDIGVVRFEGTGWQKHSHSHLAIVLVSGMDWKQLQVCETADGKPRDERFNARHVCFIAPEVVHSASWKQRTEVVVLLAREQFLERALAKRKWSGLVVAEFALLAARDRTIRSLTSLCFRLCRKGEKPDHALIEEIGRTLVRRLLDAQFNVGRESARKNATVLSPAQLQKLTAFIEADWANVRTVDELAKVVGLSRVHFARAFKNTTKVSPARYQKICRMQKAEEMLRSGNYRIEEVAIALGFKEASYFARCFREDFGMSPTEYLREYRDRIS